MDNVYNFNYSAGERNITYSCKVPDEASPTDIYDEFVQFLNAVYGWDVREHLNENITS